MLLYFALLLFLHTMPPIPRTNGWLPFSLICKESEFQDVQQQTIRPQLLLWPSWKPTAARNSAFFDQQRAKWKRILLSGRKEKISPPSATITNQDLATLAPTGSFETSYAMQETVIIHVSAAQNTQLSHRFWKINNYWTNRPASKNTHSSINRGNNFIRNCIYSFVLLVSVNVSLGAP